jgi:hypothetical protein
MLTLAGFHQRVLALAAPDEAANSSVMGCRIDWFSSLRMASRVPVLIPSFCRRAAGITIWPFELTTAKVSSIWLTSWHM